MTVIAEEVVCAPPVEDAVDKCVGWAVGLESFLEPQPHHDGAFLPVLCPGRCYNPAVIKWEQGEFTASCKAISWVQAEVSRGSEVQACSPSWVGWPLGAAAIWHPAYRFLGCTRVATGPLWALGWVLCLLQFLDATLGGHLSAPCGHRWAAECGKESAELSYVETSTPLLAFLWLGGLRQAALSRPLPLCSGTGRHSRS